MSADGKKQHYFAITNLSALLQGNSSNHEGDFYCLNCFNSYTTKNKLKKHEEICNNHNSCHIEMPKWVEKILKQNPGQKSLNAPFAIYFDLECLLKKEQSCENNPEKLNIEKRPNMTLLVGQCLQNVHLMKKKLDYCRRKDGIKKVCKKLKKRAIKIINYEEKRNDTTNL